MKISSLIEALQKVQLEHGDITVCTTGYYYTAPVNGVDVEDTEWTIRADSLDRESGLAAIILPGNWP